MGRYKKFGVGKRKFYGNRFTKENECDGTETPCAFRSAASPPSASRKKLKYLDSESDCSNANNTIDSSPIDSGELSALSMLLHKAVKCKQCGSSGSLKLVEEVHGRKGMSSKLSLVCNFCDMKECGYTSGLTEKRVYNTNIRLAYAMRFIGRVYRAAQTFCAVMDLPLLPRFDRYNKVILESMEEVASTSVKDAVKESVDMNDGNLSDTRLLEKCLHGRTQNGSGFQKQCWLDKIH